MFFTLLVVQFLNCLGLDSSFVKNENLSKLNKIENKINLIYFTNNTCTPCKKMDLTTFSNERVISQIRDEFSFLTVNVSLEKDNPLINEFNIVSYPTILFVNKRKVVLDKIIGYVSPDSLLEIMDIVKNGTSQYRMQKMKFDGIEQDYSAQINHCYFLHTKMELTPDFINKTYNSIPREAYSDSTVLKFLGDFLIYDFKTSIDFDHGAIKYLTETLDKNDTILNGRLLFFMVFAAQNIKECGDEEIILKISNVLERIKVNKSIALYNLDLEPIGDNISRNNDLLVLCEFYGNKNCNFTNKYKSTVKTLYQRIIDSPGELFYYAASLESRPVRSKFEKRISKKCQKKYEKITGERFDLESFPYIP
ncbi:MAG: thioredoxin family protein [Bacteroidetes bacterium]|nr:thioredoxin family protein [Bacteroidota bacterium]